MSEHRRLDLFEECRHFNGIQHPTCNAAVAYETVRDTSARPYRWPCIKLVGREAAVTTCSSRSLLTEEELAAREAEFEEAVREANARLARGLCHLCGKPIEPSAIVGRCKYGACGHRIGQVATGDEL